MFTDLVTKKLDDNQVEIEGVCVITKKPVKMTIPLRDFDAYFNQGVKAQYAFTTLTPSEQEFFISGISPEAWDTMFKDVEE